MTNCLSRQASAGGETSFFTSLHESRITLPSYSHLIMNSTTDEKSPLARRGSTDVEANADDKATKCHQSRNEQRSSASTYLKIASILFVIICVNALRIHGPFGLCKHRALDQTKKSKVTLEAHIMSKCPDAQVCLRDLVVPAMANISSDVDFTLSYIGKNTNGDDSVECMHGPSECLGNILELCAADLYPDPKIFLGFTNCLTMSYSKIPQKELVKECSLEHGIDFDELNHCASKDDGAFGMDLLRNSVARSANANVTKSCTVRLNGKVRCIRDGGEWKDCDAGSTPDDLIHDIQELNSYYSMPAEEADIGNRLIADHYP